MCCEGLPRAVQQGLQLQGLDRGGQGQGDRAVTRQYVENSIFIGIKIDDKFMIQTFLVYSSHTDTESYLKQNKDFTYPAL